MAIYESFYGCIREPFSLSPDPSFLFSAVPHREALAQLTYLIEERKGFAVITGEVGTGKTMLLRAVMEAAGTKVQTGYIFNPPRTREALYAAIAEELGLSRDGSVNPAMELNGHFLATYEDGGTVVLIFDEAQALSSDVLEEIRLLTNIETPRAKLVQVILAGQSELDDLIDSTKLRALRQRLVFRYSLAPLDRADTVGYIAARMAAAGASASPFSTTACEVAYRYSHGIPRLINVICDNALLSGFAEQSHTIDGRLIEDAARDLKLGVGFKRLADANPMRTDNGVRPSLARPAIPSQQGIIDAKELDWAVQSAFVESREPIELSEDFIVTRPRLPSRPPTLQDVPSGRADSGLRAREPLADDFHARDGLRDTSALQVTSARNRLRLVAAFSVAFLLAALVLGTLVAFSTRDPSLSSNWRLPKTSVASQHVSRERSDSRSVRKMEIERAPSTSHR